MLMPPIDRFMTRQPWTISSQARLADAHGTMRAHDIRHLPVVDGGRLVGIVTERDLRLLQALECASLHTAHVQDAMTEPVFSVIAEAPVDEVARTMSEHKYGCAVVTRADGVVAGVFTTTDACRALADVLQRAVA